MTAQDKFNIAHQRTMQIENGYSNISSDKGGETYNGISRVNNPGWPGWAIVDARNKIKPLARFEIIRDNKLDQLVTSFYKANYFDINNLGLVNDQDIINELYDSGVNCGVVTAAKWLQESLNLINHNQKDFKDLLIDGEIGAKTIEIVNKTANKKALLTSLNGFQFMKYYMLAFKDETQKDNFAGWLTRVEF